MRRIFAGFLLLLFLASSAHAYTAFGYCRSLIQNPALFETRSTRAYSTEDEAATAIRNELAPLRASKPDCGVWILKNECAALATFSVWEGSDNIIRPYPDRSVRPSELIMPHLERAKDSIEATVKALAGCNENAQMMFDAKAPACFSRIAICDESQNSDVSSSKIDQLSPSLRPASVDSSSFIDEYLRELSSDTFHDFILFMSSVYIAGFAAVAVYRSIRLGRRDLRALCSLASTLAVTGLIAILIAAAFNVLKPTIIRVLVSYYNGASRYHLYLIGSIFLAFIAVLLPLRLWYAAGRFLSNAKNQLSRSVSFNPVQTNPQTDERNSRSDNDVPQKQIELPISAFVPPLSQAALAQGLALKVKRSESSTMMGQPLFILDARMEVSPEIQQHIDKYRLGNAVVYESAARQKHKERAMGHLEGSRDDSSIFAPPKEQMKGVGKTVWKLARAGVSAARASLALRITVSSLIAGVHVECKSMAEIGEAEEAIVEAARNLKGHLQSASTFTGQEELIEI